MTPGNAAGSCRVQRAVVYQRRRTDGECDVSSGAAEFGDVAVAAARGWARCRRGLGGRPCASVRRA